MLGHPTTIRRVVVVRAKTRLEDRCARASSVVSSRDVRPLLRVCTLANIVDPVVGSSGDKGERCVRVCSESGFSLS